MFKKLKRLYEIITWSAYIINQFDEFLSALKETIEAIRNKQKAKK